MSSLFPVLLRHHPTNAFSFPLSSDCESTDVFLTIQSFSSSLKTLKRFSRRKRALTFRTSLGCAWVLLLAVLSVCGLLPNCVQLPITILHAATENLVSVVGLSHRAADVVPLASLTSPTSLSPPLLWVGGIRSNTKPTMLMRTCT